jgi:hypothetical protein
VSTRLKRRLGLKAAVGILTDTQALQLPQSGL